MGSRCVAPCIPFLLSNWCCQQICEIEQIRRLTRKRGEREELDSVSRDAYRPSVKTKIEGNVLSQEGYDAPKILMCLHPGSSPSPSIQLVNVCPFQGTLYKARREKKERLRHHQAEKRKDSVSRQTRSSPSQEPPLIHTSCLPCIFFSQMDYRERSSLLLVLEGESTRKKQRKNEIEGKSTRHIDMNEDWENM